MLFMERLSIKFFFYVILSRGIEASIDLFSEGGVIITLTFSGVKALKI